MSCQQSDWLFLQGGGAYVVQPKCLVLCFSAMISPTVTFDLTVSVLCKLDDAMERTILRPNPGRVVQRSFSSLIATLVRTCSLHKNGTKKTYKLCFIQVTRVMYLLLV